MIYEKLMKIQMELKAPKSQWNKFGGYNYRNCEDILEALKPLLEKNKCGLFISDNLELIGDRYYIKATVTLVDFEDSSKIENHGFAREDENRKGMNSDQLTGATSSYARKYALNGMFCIDDAKDSDFTNEHDKGEKTEDKKDYQESDLDKKFLAYWNKLTDEQRLKVGTKYPNKFNKPQNNPQYFKKSEKEEILKTLEEAKKK